MRILSPFVRAATRTALAFVALVALGGTTGCTSLQSVSVTQIPTDRGHPVRAEVWNTALLGIHFDNDFLDPLEPALMSQCPHGRITGLLTKQESTLYVIVSTRRVIATGYCVHDAPPAGDATAVGAVSPAPAQPIAAAQGFTPPAPEAP